MNAGGGLVTVDAAPNENVGTVDDGVVVVVPKANFGTEAGVVDEVAPKALAENPLLVATFEGEVSETVWTLFLSTLTNTVNQQILAAIKFGVSQNKAIYVNLAAIKFGVSPRPVYAVYDRRICWRRQILAKTRNSPNSPNIIARQNLLIYSNDRNEHVVFTKDKLS